MKKARCQGDGQSSERINQQLRDVIGGERSRQDEVLQSHLEHFTVVTATRSEDQTSAGQHFTIIKMHSILKQILRMFQK